VINAPGSNANAVAEYVLGVAIMGLRSIPFQTNRLHEKEWRDKTHIGSEIKNKVIGIVGCGAIGRLIAKKLQNFEVKNILGYDPYLTEEQMKAAYIQKTEGKHEDAMEVVRNILTSGRALEVMKTIIKAQGGNPNVTSESIQTAKFTHTCHAAKHGTISAVDNFHLNSLAKIVGAPEDRQAGLFLHKKIGEPISKDDTILTIFSNSSHAIQEAIETIKQFPIYVISN
jgi:AMP phosphorylase